MSNYGWIITEDLLNNDDGTTGPIDILSEINIRLINGEGREFRLLDDDNILYYRGRLIGGNGFEPLDDFGLPNAGCTTVQYKSGNTWKSL